MDELDAKDMGVVNVLAAFLLYHRNHPRCVETLSDAFRLGRHHEHVVGEVIQRETRKKRRWLRRRCGKQILCRESARS